MRTSLIVKETISSIQRLLKNDRNIVNIDKILLKVKAGNGGKGILRYNGVGGNGGNVYFRPTAKMSLLDIKKVGKIRAENGSDAQKTSLIGKNAPDKVFDIPIGVEIVNRFNNILIAKCVKLNQKYLIAKGGTGGSRENMFRGEKGEELEVELHLKLRPNVGLLGFPNAGKSTLLKCFIPTKSVKIADYPFTTIHPQIGFWDSKFSEEQSKFTLTIADLPGIIEGASRNRGKGYKFLKHLEYSDVVIMVVDSTGFQLKNDLECPRRNVLESIALLNKEVEAYDRRITTKPFICVLNKVDLLEDLKELENIKDHLKKGSWTKMVDKSMKPRFPINFKDVVMTSAKLGDIETIKDSLYNIRDRLHPLKDSEDI